MAEWVSLGVSITALAVSLYVHRNQRSQAIALADRDSRRQAAIRFAEIASRTLSAANAIREHFDVGVTLKVALPGDDDMVREEPLLVRAPTSELAELVVSLHPYAALAGLEAQERAILDALTEWREAVDAIKGERQHLRSKGLDRIADLLSQSDVPALIETDNCQSKFVSVTILGAGAAAEVAADPG